MLNSRYIEVTSANRDRSRFPNPALFNVELSGATSYNNSGTALDPVYNAVMEYPPPNVSFPQTYANYTHMYGPDINGSMLPSSTLVSLINGVLNLNGSLSPLHPLQLQNAYVGKTIELIANVDGGSVNATHEFRTIEAYTVLPQNQTLATTVSTLAVTETSVPINGNYTLDNIFVGWTVQFPTLDETRTVTYYRASDRRLYLDSPISGLASSLSSGDAVFLVTDEYRVELSSPFSIGSLPALEDSIDLDNYTTTRIRTGIPVTQGSIVSGSLTTFTLPASVGTTNFTGYELWITSDPVVLTGSFSATGGSTSQGTFTVTATSTLPTGFCDNMILTVTSGSFEGYAYTIQQWTNSAGTVSGTIVPGWHSNGTSPAISDTFVITQPSLAQYARIHSYTVSTRVGTIIMPLTYTNVHGTVTERPIVAGDTFDLLQFQKDNYHPLDYAESTVAQQQASCYEISLTSLTLPNVTLHSGYGGRITDYPYVYVEFRSIIQGTSANDFNTNNPKARMMIFRAPIVNDYQDDTPFVALDGHNMVQILKFRPSDAFRFGVYLPNGELFLTEEDYLSPSSTNPLLQISACFGVKRIG